MAEFSFLLPPVVLWAVLLLLSWAASWARGARLSWLPDSLGRKLTGQRMIAAWSFAQRLIAGLAWTALIVGFLAAVPRLPAAISALPDAPDLASWEPYVEAFGFLVLWSALVLVSLAIVRAIAEVVPVVRGLLAEPRWRLPALGVAYVLLSDGGVLNIAFTFNGSELLLATGGALALSYGALVVRNALQLWEHRPRLAKVLRAQLLALEAAWLAVALVAVARLPAAVEPVLTGEYDVHPNVAASYLKSFDTLTSTVALAVLLPFVLLRALGVFRPAVEKVFSFPIGRLATLGLVYALLSGEGVLSTALGVTVAGAWELLALALVLSYAAFVLRNVAGVELPGRYGSLASAGAGLAGSLAYAFAAGVAVWVGFHFLPITSAALLEHQNTATLGENSLPYFGTLFDARHPAAGLAFALGFGLGLPASPTSRAFRRVQPFLSGVSYVAAGCLAWVVGSTLSPLGHGLVLGGAAAGAGMFALAAIQLATYGATSSNRAVAFLANWSLASRVRGVMLGASVAVYVLFLRPVVYEALWFAALYEYVALLALLVLASMYIVNQLRLDSSAVEEAAPQSRGWSHHRQTLETKADPRSDLTSALRRRFVDSGDWRPLAAYMMGLLYRHGASLEAMGSVCRPLRAAASVSRFLRRSRLRRLRRMTALEAAQSHAEKALTAPVAALQPIAEGDLREAAGPFVERGVEPERLAVALIAADCQRGADLQQAVHGWFSLLDAIAPRAWWLTLPWMRSEVKLRDRQRRLDMVDDAAAFLFNSGADRPGGLGWLQYASHGGAPSEGRA